jgi:hypothetical protein
VEIAGHRESEVKPKEAPASDFIQDKSTTSLRQTLDELAKNGFHMGSAGIAQLVEQLICNQQVVGSNPTAGSL